MDISSHNALVTSTCLLLNFVFCWPCISIQSCKKNQLDAQLILSICLQRLHVSGVSMPIIRRQNLMYTTIGTYYSLQMTVVSIRLCLLMMGIDTPEKFKGWRNMLRISCAASWFFFTRLSPVFRMKPNHSAGRFVITNAEVIICS
jgi:hypothetical protein